MRCSNTVLQQHYLFCVSLRWCSAKTCVVVVLLIIRSRIPKGRKKEEEEREIWFLCSSTSWLQRQRRLPVLFDGCNFIINHWRVLLFFRLKSGRIILTLIEKLEEHKKKKKEKRSVWKNGCMLRHTTPAVKNKESYSDRPSA